MPARTRSQISSRRIPIDAGRWTMSDDFLRAIQRLLTHQSVAAFTVTGRGAPGVVDAALESMPQPRLTPSSTNAEERFECTRLGRDARLAATSRPIRVTLALCVHMDSAQR